MLEISNVSKTYSSGNLFKTYTKAVKNVSFNLEQGISMGLTGMSGCGKSTLSRLILGTIQPNTGEINYLGKSIKDMTKAEKKQYHQDVQIIFQNPQGSMNPAQTIKTTLLEPMIAHKICHNSSQRMDKIMYLMDIMGLSEILLTRYPHQISGGEAQRLVICRALTLNPKLLILDEPTSMLDVSIQAHIMVLLQKLKTELDLTYLYISHDLDLQKWFTQQLMVMYQGELVEIGKTENILLTPQMEYTKQLVYQFDNWE